MVIKFVLGDSQESRASNTTRLTPEDIDNAYLKARAILEDMSYDWGQEGNEEFCRNAIKTFIQAQDIGMIDQLLEKIPADKINWLQLGVDVIQYSQNTQYFENMFAKIPDQLPGTPSRNKWNCLNTICYRGDVEILNKFWQMVPETQKQEWSLDSEKNHRFWSSSTDAAAKQGDINFFDDFWEKIPANHQRIHSFSESPWYISGLFKSLRDQPDMLASTKLERANHLVERLDNVNKIIEIKLDPETYNAFKDVLALSGTNRFVHEAVTGRQTAHQNSSNTQLGQETLDQTPRLGNIPSELLNIVACHLLQSKSKDEKTK
jgi:hypothetical protein